MTMVVEWGETKRQRPPGGASLLMRAFNYLGLVSHGGWFLAYPVVQDIHPDHRAAILSILAVPLLLGHLHLYRVIHRRYDKGRD